MCIYADGDGDEALRLAILGHACNNENVLLGRAYKKDKAALLGHTQDKEKYRSMRSAPSSSNDAGLVTMLSNRLVKRCPARMCSIKNVFASETMCAVAPPPPDRLSCSAATRSSCSRRSASACSISTR